MRFRWGARWKCERGSRNFLCGLSVRVGVILRVIPLACGLHLVCVYFFCVQIGLLNEWENSLKFVGEICGVTLTSTDSYVRLKRLLVVKR